MQTERLDCIPQYVVPGVSPLPANLQVWIDAGAKCDLDRRRDNLSAREGQRDMFAEAAGDHPMHGLARRT